MCVRKCGLFQFITITERWISGLQLVQITILKAYKCCKKKRSSSQLFPSFKKKRTNIFKNTFPAAFRFKRFHLFLHVSRSPHQKLRHPLEGSRHLATLSWIIRSCTCCSLTKDSKDQKQLKQQTFLSFQLGPVWVTSKTLSTLSCLSSKSPTGSW